MIRNPKELAGRLNERFSADGVALAVAFDEVTMQVPVAVYKQTMQAIRDEPEFAFGLLVDLCGVDYLGYGDQKTLEHPRFAVVTHLLSVEKNSRLRVRVFSEDDEHPSVPSVMPIWPAANWFEREAFDLYGILFEGHPDLRRILTDYGFVGHPFRKDFPIEGYVELRYDETQKRIVYEPVSIKPREITPRVIRKRGWHG